MFSRIGLQGKIILLIFFVLAIVLTSTAYFTSRIMAQNIQDSMARQAASVARMVAKSDVVVDGLAGRRAPADIQHYAMDNLDSARVRFIVVLDMNGIRQSHPNVDLIGQLLVGGDGGPVLRGEEYISVAEGTLGHSLRAFTPVYDRDGHQIGAVLVGILMDYVNQAVQSAHTIIFLATAVGLVIGAAGALLLARHIKHILFGLEPEAIAKRLVERSAMLQSVREGILAIDTTGAITLLNDEARRLLRLAGIDGDPMGKPVQQFFPQTRLPDVVVTGKTHLNEDHDFYGLPLLVNRIPLIVDGVSVGAIATFRDKTEVKQLAEELTGVRGYVEALRSQAHEFMNKLHVILGLVQLESYDQLSSYVNRIALDHQAEISFVGQRIRDPVLAGFILSKLSLARERDVHLLLTEDSNLPLQPAEAVTHELVTILGNLLENAFDAVRDQPQPQIELQLQQAFDHLLIIISDNGCGIPPELGEAIFHRGISAKGPDRGLGLALVHDSLRRLQGRISYVSPPGAGTTFYVTIPSAKEGSG